MEATLGFVNVLGTTLLHFLWQGAAIGLIAAGLLRYSTRKTAQVRYAVCIGALLACAIAPIATALIIADVFASDAPLSETHAPGAGVFIPVRLTQVSAAIHSSSAVMEYVVVIWLLGVLGVTIYYTLLWRSVSRIRSAASLLPSSHPLAQIANCLKEGWAQTANIPVKVCEMVCSPMVIGVVRPVIVFPSAMLARISPADFELILLHELAHIIRRDTWVNAVQIVLEIVLFYHPAVHYLSKRARLERECACDDFVVEASGSAYRYAQALTGLALAKHPHAAVALGAAGGDLIPRLRYLAGDCIEEESLPRDPLRLALLALVIALIGFGIAQEPWEKLIDKPAPVATQAEVAQRRAEAALALPEAVPVVTASTPFKRRTPRPSPRYRDVPMNDVALPDFALPSVEIEEPPTELAPVPAPENLVTGELSVTPTFNPMPEYPPRARLEGIEGEVSAVIRVGPDGRARGLQIENAEPLGVFEGSVRRALMQWRYDVASMPKSMKSVSMSYQLHFKLSGVASTATGICATATASRTCSPR